MAKIIFVLIITAMMLFAVGCASTPQSGTEIPRTDDTGAVQSDDTDGYQSETKDTYPDSSIANQDVMMTSEEGVVSDFEMSGLESISSDLNDFDW